MDHQQIIRDAVTSGKSRLNETESKRFLAGFGIPVVQEIVTTEEAAAVDAAHSLGFPVVLKGVGLAFSHKTEMGMVHLNVSDEQTVHKVVRDITAAAGDQLEGISIQPQISGQR